jgi:hypothetical protein
LKDDADIYASPLEGTERMSIVSIMAAILEEELHEHGIDGLSRLDREAIVRSMIERTAGLDTRIKQRLFGSHLDDPN